MGTARPHAIATRGTRPGAAARAPTVSIVVPVYNGARFLREALDSILSQTFTDFELIAVDDRSTDETPAILAEYAAREPRLRVIANPVNLKLPASLNVGFAAARGQWFTWTSDDNVLDPAMLDCLLGAATEGQGADVVYAGFRVIDDAGRVLRRESVADPADMVFGNVVGCCFLYRREMDRVLGGYDETLFGVEDYDFWVRAARHGFLFRPVDAELYSYRRHERSLTSTRSRSIHRLAAQVMLREIAALPPSSRRAEAYVRLVCKDHYDRRWELLRRAWRDDRATVLAHWRELAGWLKYSVRVRLGTRLWQLRKPAGALR